ncbi:ribosome maturation factor isoform X1 [Wolffia australiana]
MQRQSIGSPGAKTPQEEEDDASKKKWKRTSMADVEEARQEGEAKLEKPIRRSSFGGVASQPSAAVSAALERSIHFIPVLTLFCFLVLYLCSRDPAAADLRAVGDLDLVVDAAGAMPLRFDSSNMMAVTAASGGSTATTGNQRSLEEIGRIPGRHVSKKLWRRAIHQ